MQGKPATGKTTIAKAIQSAYINNSPVWTEGNISDAQIVSADAFLWDGDKYVWTHERGLEAHQEAQMYAERLMDSKTPLVIIDNTNLRYKWVAPYFALAKRYNYSVQVIRVDAEYNLQEQQNNTRPNDRKIPLEIYRWAVIEDLLCESYVQSFLERCRMLWSLFARLFLMS